MAAVSMLLYVCSALLIFTLGFISGIRYGRRVPGATHPREMVQECGHVEVRFTSYDWKATSGSYLAVQYGYCTACGEEQKIPLPLRKTVGRDRLSEARRDPALVALGWMYDKENDTWLR